VAGRHAGRLDIGPSGRTPWAGRPARRYERRRPEETPLHKVVSENLEGWLEWRDRAERPGPGSVEDELRGSLECGILCFGFAHARCTGCDQGFVVAFCCKGRGVCPSCNGRRMAQTAALRPAAFRTRTALRDSRRRRPPRPPAGRPPTGANPSSAMTTTTSSNRRPTSCPRSTSTASERCQTRPTHVGRLRTGTRPAPTREKRHFWGKGAVPREPLTGPGQPREAGATRSRAAHPSGDARGSAIDRAICKRPQDFFHGRRGDGRSRCPAERCEEGCPCRRAGVGGERSQDGGALPASSERSPQRSESSSLRFAGATFQAPRAWNQATQGAATVRARRQGQPDGPADGVIHPPRTARRAMPASIRRKTSSCSGQIAYQ